MTSSSGSIIDHRNNTPLDVTFILRGDNASDMLGLFCLALDKYDLYLTKPGTALLDWMGVVVKSNLYDDDDDDHLGLLKAYQNVSNKSFSGEFEIHDQSKVLQTTVVGSKKSTYDTMTIKSDGVKGMLGMFISCAFVSYDRKLNLGGAMREWMDKVYDGMKDWRVRLFDCSPVAKVISENKICSHLYNDFADIKQDHFRGEYRVVRSRRPE